MVVFVLGGGAGASQLPGCEGEGGPVSFGVVVVLSLGGAGGQSASGAVKGGRGRVSFRGCEGGNGRLQLPGL